MNAQRATLKDAPARLIILAREGEPAVSRVMRLGAASPSRVRMCRAGSVLIVEQSK